MITATEQQKRVIEVIARYAEANNLKLGDRLPPIRDIAREFGMGYVTVAQTVNMMARNGILETQKKGGTRIIKHLSPRNEHQICRIITLDRISGDNSGASQETQIGIRRGIKHILPKAEQYNIWLSNEDEMEDLENTLFYHYHLRNNKQNIVFLLANCPRQIKKYFQDNNIPAVVNGGNEHGIDLPNVTFDTNHVVSELINVLKNNKGFPAVFLYDQDMMGMMAEYLSAFQSLDSQYGPSTVSGNALRMGNSPDILKAQIVQLLSGSNRPRTLLVPGDETGSQMIRICYDLGIRIPQDLGIISMESSPLSELLKPSLTGIYCNPETTGEYLGRMIERIVAGESLVGEIVREKPVIVYRESFVLNPV